MINLKTMKNIAIFKDLSNEHLESLEKILKIIKVPKNSDIIKDGESGSSMFILSSVTITIILQLPDLILSLLIL